MMTQSRNTNVIKTSNCTLEAELLRSNWFFVLLCVSDSLAMLDGANDKILRDHFFVLGMPKLTLIDSRPSLATRQKESVSSHSWTRDWPH